jgi:hypothetical protein
VAASLVGLHPRSAGAWGSFGHAVIGALAERRLDPEVRSQVQQLLGGLRLWEPQVGDWADARRHRDRRTEPWHYVNVPLSAAAYDRGRDCPSGECVVAKLDELLELLRSPTTDIDERRTALLFVVHLVADVHQPLHCGNADDRGGNGIRLRYRQRDAVRSLHAVWDTAMIEDLAGTLTAVEYAERLERSAAAPVRWNVPQASTPEAWVNESHDVARQVYRGVPRAENGELPWLRDEYLKGNRRLLDQQLVRAGERLALVLSRLAPPRGSAPSVVQP